MSGFTFYRTLLTLLLATASVLAADKPNVLFIAIDDLRPSLGCYGDPIAKTPNIDGLSRTARQFNRAYCMQSVCGPSRTAILTGPPARQHRGLAQSQPLSRKVSGLSDPATIVHEQRLPHRRPGQDL